MRRIIAIFAGTILANLVIFGWEMLLQRLPFGRVIDVAETTRPGFVVAIPLAAKLWIVTGWGLGALAGGFLAFRVARWDYAGWIVAAIVAALGILNIAMIPHPLWMQLCAVANPFIGALIGFGLYRRARAAQLHLRTR